MIKPLILALSIVFLFFSCDTEESDPYDLLILNARIVDVEKDTVLENRLILISGDTIMKIDKMFNQDRYIARAIIDVENKYVMPGLWDMHVHFRGGDTLIDENKNMLPLFLAYGVTTVRDGGGDITPSVLEWREQIKKGELTGPTIFTPGPKLDGEDPAWPGSIRITSMQDIEPALDSLQEIKADFVKIYDGSLSPEIFYSIIEAAEERGLKTTGHMPMSASFLKAIDYGLDGTEHMYYAMKATSPKEDSLTQLDLGYRMMEHIIATYDTALAKKVFNRMKNENVFITPTLYIVKTLARLADEDHSGDSLLSYIGPGIQETYKRRLEGAKRAKAQGNSMRNKMEVKSKEMIVPMYREGVKIVAGSDSGPYNSFVYPGQSLHGELRELTDAGLDPVQALKTSVVHGPEFFGLGKYYGSIEGGKVADLVILEENPLENIDNTLKIISIIKAGKIYNRGRLDRMLNSVKDSYN